MKLTPALVEKTLNQFEAQAIPDDHPVVSHPDSPLLAGTENQKCLAMAR